ncbi:GNAT family N-acetyltransferase [Oceanobacter mangrovi]|uniref:GNAT family N-acetyltransferase n=1 Tax=Oceanobacter mangrovi TaxID=2862510 RepID=UPI001C8E2E5B|nr:GNAT family N-acetyltransferase [Oceanobacter mangrovi]
MPARIIETRWTEQEAAISAIREQVYIQEQGIAPEDEWDPQGDAEAIYLLAFDAEQPVGCVRLLPDGHFGRLAVLKSHRSSGLGAQLVNGIADIAQREGHPTLLASAQCSAVGFYQRLGFLIASEFFDDAGIPHLEICKPLNDSAAPAIFSNHWLLGENSNIHTLASPFDIEGCLLTLLGQGPLKLQIAIANPENPLWHNERLLDALTRHIRKRHSNPLPILLGHEQGINDKPLVRLLRRASSKFDVRVHSGLTESFWLIGSTGWVQQSSDTDARASAHDPRHFNQLQQQFEDLFRTANKAREMRQLGL